MSDSAKPLDVAFLLGAPEISGGVNVIFEHAAGLRARGHRVAVVCQIPAPPGGLEWHDRTEGLEFLDHTTCSERRFDVAVATWWRSVFDLPRVIAAHHAYFVQSVETRFAAPDDPESRALADFTYRLPLAIVTEAQWIVDHLWLGYGRHAALVRNGVRKDLFTPDGPVLDGTRPRGLRVLVEGRLDVASKRTRLAIEVCRHAGLEDIWLLSPSPAGTAVPGTTRVLSGLTVRDVPPVYRSCDVLVKLSTVEGMFGPPLEMMHCGGTAVVSDVTGADEYVRDGENAIVVPQGEEHRAVEALRRLARDPTLLARLRAGAGATADAWRGWDVAVDEMEAFVVATAAATPDAAHLRRDLASLLPAALDLATPLRLARDRDRAAWYLAYPSATLRRIAKRLAYDALRRIHAAAPAPRPQPVLGPRAMPLPTPCRPAWQPDASHPRVCFVGDPARHLAHVPRDVPEFDACFVDARHGVSARVLADVAAARPDVTVVFVPERLRAHAAVLLPGLVVGVVTSAPTLADTAALRVAFPRTPAPDGRVACLVDPDAARLPLLLREGVNAVAAFLPPLDVSHFAVDADDAAWRARPIDVLLVYEGGLRRTRIRDALRAAIPILEVRAPSSELLLAPVLRAARVTVFLDDARADPLLAAKVVRDAMAGCLVAAPPVPAPHGFVAGEHYIPVPDEADTARILEAALGGSAAIERVRRLGRERAEQLAAPRRWLDLFAALAGRPP